MPKTPKSILLDRQQTMEYLGIGHTTLWSLQVAGELSPVRIGKRVLFRLADLDRFVSRAARSGVKIQA